MKLSKALIAASVLVMMVAGPFSTGAMGFGRPHHGAGLFGLKALLELNLSGDQKSQILAIFGKYDLKTVRNSLWQARRNLRTQLQAASDEGSIDGIVSAHLQQVAPLQQQLVSMRAKMRYEIKAVLTSEQINKLLEQHWRGPQGGSPTTPTP